MPAPPRSHETVKGGPHYERALVNIRHLIRRRRHIGPDAKQYSVAIVVQDANAHQTIPF